MGAGLRWRPALRFADGDLDAAFRREHDAAAIPQAQLAGVLAIVLYAAFGYLDTLVVPGDVSSLFLIRFAIVCPLIACVLVVVSIAREGWRVLQPAVCFVVVVASFGLDVMPEVADVPEDYARTGGLLILMFLFAFARVRFAWAMATTVVVVAGYETSVAIGDSSWETVLYNNFFLLGFVVIGASASYSLERLRREEFVRERELAGERARSDALLHNILPEEIATRLRHDDASIADAADGVSVLFADIVGFTPLAERLPPHDVVALLDELFTAFDALCDRHGIEKIKTVGDAYMAVAGIPRPDPDHAASTAGLALEMQEVAADLSARWPTPLQLRIGISSGPVVAGVIGRRKFAYDLWGDTVNTASRMEHHGEAGRIHVSASTYALLADRYRFSGPVETPVKGKGTVTTYFLEGTRNGR